MKQGQLQRLVIFMPHYGFKNHFGFEGVRSNGIQLELMSNQGFLSKAVSSTNALDPLATAIAEIPGDKIMANIDLSPRRGKVARDRFMHRDHTKIKNGLGSRNFQSEIVIGFTGVKNGYLHYKKRACIKKPDQFDRVFPVVPPGIEPGTQGFSVLCSTN